LFAASSLRIDGEAVVQTRRVSQDIDNFSIPCWSSIYIDAETTDQLYQEHKDWSIGRRWEHLIERDLVRNSKSGIKSAIIDSAFERLSVASQEKILNFADKSMEQIIILAKTLPDDVQNRPCMMKSWVHRIEYDPQNLSSRIVERKETAAAG